MKPKKPMRLWLTRNKIGKQKYYALSADRSCDSHRYHLPDPIHELLGLPNLKTNERAWIERGPDGVWRKVK